MKSKHIIISGIALFLITILLLGLTYAYYKTKVIGNNNEKTISSVGKKLEITYTDGNGVIEAAEIEPGYTATKTFSVKNTGDDTATYSIKLNKTNRHGVMMKEHLAEPTYLTKGLCNRESNFVQNSRFETELWFGVNNSILFWVGITEKLGIYNENKTKEEILNEFDTWLLNNPTYVIYKLNKAKEESLEIPSIKVTSGTKKFAVNTNINPSNIEVKP